MILDKEVTVKWSAKNINHFRDKGYNFKKFGEEFTVKIEDLPIKSHAKVRVKCYYCNEINKVKMQTYYHNVINSEVKKYGCGSCRDKKRREIAEKRLERGEIKKGENYYYSLKDVRMSELKKCLEEEASFSHIYNTGLALIFRNHKHDLLEAIGELGYNHMELRQVKPNNYWDDFERVKEVVDDFISIYKRFPNYDEMRNELKIPRGAIEKHGGMYQIKKKMKYKKNEDLIDNRGDYNRSTYELITANFLIAQEIPYKREQKPFKNDKKNLRSDFTLYPENKKPIHIEIWGFVKNDKCERAVEYYLRRNEKEKLYKENKITLISVEPNVFKQSYEKIEEELNKIFAKQLKLKYKKVEQKKIIPANAFTDEELLNIIMKYSDNPKYLPQTKILVENESGVYKEIVKRYKSLREFGEKYKKMNIKISTSYWTEEKILEKLLYMIQKYGEYLGKDKLEKNKDPFLIGLTSAVKKHGGLTKNRLKLYKHCLENNIKLPEKEINYIKSKNIRDVSLPIDTPIDEIIEYALKEKMSN